MPAPGVVELDKQITDGFAVLAVLLTFVFAFFTIMIALAETLLASSVPTINADKERDRGQVRLYCILFGIVGLAALSVLAVVMPLSITVAMQSRWLPWQSDYSVVRGGLAVTDLFLVITFAVAIVNIIRLRDRRSRY